MHMSGTDIGEVGHGQGPGAGSPHGGCNPRKFSEKIALHAQRQADNTAAFREVMMDITSIRVQAERVREARGMASYYGGSLPNVNQISRCSTETQYSSYLNQQHLEADEGYKDIQPGPFGRPHKRHFDSAPYLSTQLSPPRGSAWKGSNRFWSSCSATEKTQMVHLPLTALNRTNSDSALHTSVRNIQMHGHPKSAQVLNPQTKHSMFAHSVPLIEENFQEETSPKMKKLSSLASSGYGTPVVHFPLPDQQGSSLLVPTALSTSGSLPDLSSLHLPSPLPVGQDSEPHHLSTTSAHPNIMADFTLPSLSSSLQASLSNPLLQSSLSNPNIQSSLSSHSLPSSLSSTSLHLSLSNSSLRSSLSNQSLQSSLSSSSLSNQSSQSSISRCSYSSGLGGSPSCSSPSLAGSPRVPGHTHAVGSRKRAQLSPLIVSGGDSRWQHPKQFSPTVSPNVSSVTQGSVLNPNKVFKETKPPAYPCSPLLKTSPSMSHQPVRQYFPSDAQHQSIPEMEQWSEHYHATHHEHQPQQLHHQQTHIQTQPHLFNSQHHIHNQTRQIQQHLHPQSNYQQQLLYHSNTQQFPQHQQPVRQHQPFAQAPHLSKEQYQCTSRWQLPCQQGQYQGQLHQQFHQPAPNTQEKSWNCVTSPHVQPHTRVKHPLGPCVQAQGRSKPQFKTEGKSVSNSLEGGTVPASLSSCDKGFKLNKDSYVGLHLTPSQAKALSQQLGVLQKEPLGGGKGSDPNCQDAESHEQPAHKNILPQQNQSCGADKAQNCRNISFNESLSWLDQNTSDLSDSVLDFDLETFGLDSEGFPSLEDLAYAQ
ncbi:CREB-regulated transcription coactivator 2 [Misgurnus anguillicaudatus]|uniref:CREB-regulated transcription coactivator 2 n=1 Tax=Misgurnus anguillicaudatus TaxID=75329 RepID=UPI003CCF765F